MDISFILFIDEKQFEQTRGFLCARDVSCPSNQITYYFRVTHVAQEDLKGIPKCSHWLIVELIICKMKQIWELETTINDFLVTC